MEYISRFSFAGTMAVLGTQMELFISFSSFIHVYEGLSAHALADCVCRGVFKGWQVMLGTH